ncbi:unnamed protein product [Phytophthora lilii]|uniref:Unnamed protein product n=1 Tax=Phytophthora lilii TaxID=2077276 RepID=A0A9W6WTA1_9STRA|nr:unnamed protein product [Phytophthora lilii]
MKSSTRMQKLSMPWWIKLSDALYKMQLPHYGGKYSMERMLALEEYAHNTSLLRVLLVIISPAAFTAAVLIIQDSAPLQDPSNGWQANWGFWVRAGILGFANGHEAITQIPPWLNVPRFSSRQIFVFSLFTGLGIVAGGIAVAEIWVFPIPFFLLTLSLVLSAVLIGLMRIVAGSSGFRLIASRKDELSRLNNVASLETLMCAGYPAYQVLFTKVNHTPFELPVLLMLSVIKLVMKRVFRSAATHEEDMIPKQVIFTVDLFNSFYLATFMQRLQPSTLLVVMLVDIAESTIELRELYQRTRKILAQLNEVTTLQENSYQTGSLLNAVRRLILQNATSIQKTIHGDSRIRSCIVHDLSTESRNLLEYLDKTVSDSSNKTKQSKASPLSQFGSVAPIPGRIASERLSGSGWLSGTANDVVATAKLAPGTLQQSTQIEMQSKVEKVRRRSPAANEATVIHDSLEVLFTSECLVLTEYVEIIIPSIYGLFILVMVHLPSAKYHSEMEGVTLETVGGMVSRIFVYALLELFSFTVLAIITKRNCGIHVLYQLAFVLETEMAFVPSKLVLWILFTLTYRVTHFGKRPY